FCDAARSSCSHRGSGNASGFKQIKKGASQLRAPRLQPAANPMFVTERIISNRSSVGTYFSESSFEALSTILTSKSCSVCAHNASMQDKRFLPALKLTTTILALAMSENTIQSYICKLNMRKNLPRHDLKI